MTPCSPKTAIALRTPKRNVPGCCHLKCLHLWFSGVDYFISGGGAFGKVYEEDEEMTPFVSFKSDAAGVMSIMLSEAEMESRFLATNGTVLHTAITKV